MFNQHEMNVPTFDLELRIAPLVKQMVYKMLLSEEDAKKAIEDAISGTVANFDWRAQIRKQVEETLQHEVRKIVENVARRLLWDEEIMATVKVRVAKALTEGAGRD